ncbi:hypothetical protein [Bradyrhizobium sp. RT4b]
MPAPIIGGTMMMIRMMLPVDMLMNRGPALSAASSHHHRQQQD